MDSRLQVTQRYANIPATEVKRFWAFTNKKPQRLVKVFMRTKSKLRCQCCV